MADQRAWNIRDVAAVTDGELAAGAGHETFDGISIDSRTLQKGELFVAIAGQRYDGHDFIDQVLAQGAGGVMIDRTHAAAGIGTRIKSAGAPCVVVENTVRALGDLARHRRRVLNPRVAAITGTNGKTTTKEMAASVCRQRYRVLSTAGNFNNEIGLPLTLFRLEKQHRVAVLELGMSAPGEMGRLAKICEPDLGVVLNVGAGHLAGLESLDGVAKAKGELIEGLGKRGVAVLNADDARVARMAEKAPGRVITWGVSPGADVRAESVRRSEGRVCFDLILPGGRRTAVALPVAGAFMVSNALAAAAVGEEFGVSAAEIKAGLEGFSPVPGRMTVVQTRAGFTLVDDTYNANPESMKAALTGLRELKGAGRGILIMGDMFELGDHAPLMHGKTGVMAAESGVNRLYVTGEFAEAVAGGAASAGMAPEKIMTGSKEEIIAAACSVLGPGDWVLVKGSRGMRMETVVRALLAHGDGATETKGSR